MRISGWTLAGVGILLAGAAGAASPDAAPTVGKVASSHGGERVLPVQVATRAGQAPVFDGFDIRGRRLRVRVGQSVTVRIWSHIQREHSYRLLPNEGVEQVGATVLYTAPPAPGVGFTNAYDVTVRATRAGVFPVSIVSAHNQTGVRNDISASPVHFELEGVAVQTPEPNDCDAPRYLNADGECVSPPPRN
jgi:hypothetical protein